jgi:hypothetical protein
MPNYKRHSLSALLANPLEIIRPFPNDLVEAMRCNEKDCK